MPDPAPIPVSDDSYRPISGLALSGLIVSALFAVLIGASLAVGVAKGTPIFFPIAIVLVAVVGFGLSYAGYRQIASSEGTRVGAGIARLGMALAVVSGLGYAAYSMSIGLAVATQADDFLAGPVVPEKRPESGFLQCIREAPNDPAALNKAFLLTLQPSLRGRADPTNESAFRRQYDTAVGPEGQGHLTIFRNSIWVRMLSRGGQIESLGMRGWEHDKQSYKVGRAYRLTTPEGTLTVTLEAESAEGEVEGQSRRWFVDFSRSGIDESKLTPLGVGVQRLREEGRQFLQTKWLPKLLEEKPDIRVKLIGTLDKSDWTDLVRDLKEWMVDGKNPKRERIRSDFRKIVGGKIEPMASFALAGDNSRTWPTWSHDDKGRLWFRHPFNANIPEPGAPPNQADGWVLLRTTEPMPLQKMESPAAAPMWEVESILIDRIRLR